MSLDHFLDQRYLDRFEVAMFRVSPSLIVEYRGQINQSAMAQAFELLYICHPVLRARVRTDEDGHMLYVSTRHHPEVLTCDGDESALLREVERPWNPALCLVQLIVAIGDNRGYVALRVDHSIVDGSSLVAVYSDLWRLYTDIVNGVSVCIQPNDRLPVPPGELLIQRWGPCQDVTQCGVLANESNRPTSGEVVTRWAYLSEDHTARLIAAARTHGTSVHALICGSILVALRAELASEEPIPMECTSIVDLRNRVEPPVGATETTNFLGFHTAEVPVPADGNAINVGREVKRQLDEAVSRRELTLNRRAVNPGLSITKASLKEADQLQKRRLSVSVSNARVFPQLSTPDGLVLTNAFTHTPPDAVPGFSLACVVFTFERGLRIRFLCPGDLLTVEQVDELLDRATDEMRRIGDMQDVF